MLEYDQEIKPTKLIKGQGLARLMVESLIQVSEMFLQSPWYSDIVYVLQHLSPPLIMTKNKARSLKLKAAKLCILNNALYWKDLGGVLLSR